MKRSSLAFILLLGLLSSCATSINKDELSSDEQVYLNKVSAAATQIAVDNAKSDKVWDRGNEFIRRFSGMDVATATDHKVVTEDPAKVRFGSTLGYELTRKEEGDQTIFSVKCLHHPLNMKYNASVCRNNEKIMAYYMETGELNDKFVNTKMDK